MAQGKIVVEESPLTTFFNRTLPDWSMNLLSMQARMSEARKKENSGQQKLKNKENLKNLKYI